VCHYFFSKLLLITNVEQAPSHCNGALLKCGTGPNTLQWYTTEITLVISKKLLFNKCIFLMKLIKAVLIVKKKSPQSVRDTTMQMYCTSLEPKRGLGQGADLSVLTAITHTLPHAKSLHDIRVHKLSATAVSRAMIADFNSLQAELIFDASHVTPGVNETSEQTPLTSCFNIRSAQDTIGYTKATPDPKHHSQAMHSSCVRNG